MPLEEPTSYQLTEVDLDVLVDALGAEIDDMVENPAGAIGGATTRLLAARVLFSRLIIATDVRITPGTVATLLRPIVVPLRPDLAFESVYGATTCTRCLESLANCSCLGGPRR
jgi:hypothetical protein